LRESDQRLMARTVLQIEDVGGSFARLLKQAPKVMRQCVYDALDRTAFALSRRMEASAPVGPDAPHIKDHVTWKRRGLTAQAGFIDATQQAGPNNDATIAEVAMFNEYLPNKQPFMRPAAESEASDFVKRMKAAIGQAERDLSGGGGLL
jgi:hypothetical protein